MVDLGVAKSGLPRVCRREVKSEEHGEWWITCPKTQCKNCQCLLGMMAEMSYSVICPKSFRTELRKEVRL